ncbi:MAG: hypothetical protein FWH21_00120 [Kiritimatiellaeota bacterium]|nr:hypothetical protein [Kiritimatiellota bacterium]
MERKNILTGPGALSYGGVVIHDADGITVNIDSATQDIPSSVSGKLDTIKTDQRGVVTLTPGGVISQPILDILYPHQAPAIGSRVCGAADTPLTVHGTDGKKVTLLNAALTKIPDLRLSAVKTAFGQAEFTALVADNKRPDAPDAFCKVAEEAYAAGYPDPNAITGTAYTAAFGSLTLPDTVDGWTVTFELGLEPLPADDVGTVDLLLTDVTVRASCTPLGKGLGEILAALPVSKGRGASTRTGGDLVITGQGGGLEVTLHNAALVTGPLQWGSTQLRFGQLGFVAHRRVSDGRLYSVELGVSN